MGADHHGNKTARATYAHSDQTAARSRTRSQRRTDSKPTAAADAEAEVTLATTMNPVCPYCSAPLPKIPSRKTKCPQCRQPMYLKRYPDETEKHLMTEAEAQKVEDAWQRRYQTERGRNELAMFGLADHPILQQVLLNGGDVDEATERLLLMATETSETAHDKKMAHHLLAVRMVKRGDDGWREHLNKAKQWELKQITERLPAEGLSVDILPGHDQAVCQAMRNFTAIPIADEVRVPKIPNRFCPGAGFARGFCICSYAVSKEWFSRPR